MVIYRELTDCDLNLELFASFQRHQIVTDCWRRIDGRWTIVPVPFIAQWTPEDYRFLVECLINTLEKGGIVYGAFLDHVLKGFVSVEGTPLGSRNQYLDLTSLHVSEELRRQGIGKRLFHLACQWALERQAEKLYISSHSAAETQCFYRGLGCIEAEEYQEAHVLQEPYDCQLEFILKPLEESDT